MTNEQQTYVLKRPINAWPNFDSDEMVVELENDDYRCSLEAFNEDFVPLDVSGLTRQVEELLDGDYRSYSDYLDWCDMPPKEKRIKLHSTAEQIVLLLLNQEKETKQ
mgnify:CR=1 FL=1